MRSDKKGTYVPTYQINMLSKKLVYQKIINKLYRIFYWIIPIIILFLIFRRIDLIEFELNISKANYWLIILGLALGPLATCIGAFRWKLLIKYYNAKNLNIRFVLKHYWIGLALGYFTPSSLGCDGYRVLIIGRNYGQYIKNIIIVFIEKFIALITCTSLIIFLYPLVQIQSSPIINNVLQVTRIFFYFFLIIIVLIIFILHNRIGSKIFRSLENSFEGAINKFRRKFELEDRKDLQINFKEMITPLTNIKQLMCILILSFAIQFLGAIINHIYFKAVGCDTTLIANMFIVPILFLIFFLPISFGGIGILQGAYIILYGLLGVPSEIALLVSFFTLFGSLLTVLIGGLIMLVSNVRINNLAKPIS